MKKEIDPIHAKLDEIIGLLQRLVAIELSSRGVSKQLIAKNLHVAKSTIVHILAGMKKDGANDR